MPICGRWHRDRLESKDSPRFPWPGPPPKDPHQLTSPGPGPHPLSSAVPYHTPGRPPFLSASRELPAALGPHPRPPAFSPGGWLGIDSTSGGLGSPGDADNTEWVSTQETLSKHREKPLRLALRRCCVWPPLKHLRDPPGFTTTLCLSRLHIG